MEIKKTPKADLENKKILFREIGLILALAVVLLAFEWKTYDKQISTLGDNTAAVIEEEMIPIINTEDDKNLGVQIKDYVKGPVEEVIEDEEIPFTIVEEKPSFQGGDENTFTKWVASKLVYPEIAKENGVQGRVILQFLVGTDGSVSDVKVVRGVDASLDKEAARVVASSPKWKPGRQRNKPVKVRYTFPVIFQLR